MAVCVVDVHSHNFTKIVIVLLMSFIVYRSCGSPIFPSESIGSRSSSHWNNHIVIYLDECVQNMPDKSAKCSSRNLLEVPSYLYPDIQKLDVSSNRLDGVRNNSFYGYTELHEIDLEFNHISFIEIGTFFLLKYLSNLQLSYNPIIKFSAQIFIHSINLQILGLEQVKLEHIPNETVEFLPNSKQSQFA